MLENAFLDKNIKPSEGLIQKKLKSTYPVLQQLRKMVEINLGETLEEWKYYGAKNGWVLKTFLKKRNLFFLSMYEGFFKISFVFGEKTAAAILESDISENLKKDLSEARKYTEGRGLTITIKDDSNIQDVEKLIKFKVAN